MSRRGFWDRLRLALGHYPVTADEWAVRVQSDDIERHEFLALDEWLKADPRNAEDYARMNKVAHLGLNLRDHPELRARLNHYPLPSARAASRVRWAHGRGLRFFAGASIAVAAIGIGLATFLPASLSGTNYAVARGEQRQVTLADSSRMTLNTDTEVRVTFDASRRSIELVRGEALFDVSRDPSRPFVVLAGRTQVRAVGTRFSVRRDGEEIRVVVAEGRVEVLRVAASDSPSQASPPVELHPGRLARISANAATVRVASVDVDRETAWTVGNVDFEEATLFEVLRDVNRYTVRQFVIADPSLGELRLSGRFRVGDVESVRSALRDRFDIKARDEADRILLAR